MKKRMNEHTVNKKIATLLGKNFTAAKNENGKMSVFIFPEDVKKTRRQVEEGCYVATNYCKNIYDAIEAIELNIEALMKSKETSGLDFKDMVSNVGNHGKFDLKAIMITILNTNEVVLK